MKTPKPQDDYLFSAAFYDYVERYRTRPDVDFFVRAARDSGGPVLELGSGTGRVLIPTARAGIEITGLDGSTAMLAVCGKNLSAETAELRSRVTLIEGDLRTFSLKKQFALITTPFRPFQHLLTISDQLACLVCVRRHLAPDGRFILDIFNPSLEALVKDDIGREWPGEAVGALPDGSRVERRNCVTAKDRTEQTVSSEVIYHVTRAGGHQERFTQSLVLRYLFRWEAEHLLARAGFTVENVCGNYDGTPFDGRTSPEIIITARI